MILTGVRNLFGQFYCGGPKHVSEDEVKKAFDALNSNEKQVITKSSQGNLVPQAYLAILKQVPKNRNQCPSERTQRSNTPALGRSRLLG